MLSATGPNRTYLWGGTIDADKKYSGFTAYNGGDELGKYLLWETYAETLQKAGRQLAGLPVRRRLRRQRPGVLQARSPSYDPTQGGTAAPGNVFYDNGVANVPEPVTGLTRERRQPRRRDRPTCWPARCRRSPGS